MFRYFILCSTGNLLAVWSELDDTQCKCGGPHGAVTRSESIARLIMSQDPDLGYNPFSRSEVRPPKGRSIDNTCGFSDGMSVDRCDTLSRDDIINRGLSRQKALAQQRIDAGKLPNKRFTEAAIAFVADIRELHSSSQMPCFRVYDDPSSENAEHAVIRLDRGIDEVEVSGLVDSLKQAFSRSILMDDTPK